MLVTHAVKLSVYNFSVFTGMGFFGRGLRAPVTNYRFQISGSAMPFPW